MITETEQISAALAAAAELWPELQGNRAGLLARLIDAGHLAICPQLERQKQDYADRVAQIAGIFGNQEYPRNYLADLRAEWPQ